MAAKTNTAQSWPRRDVKVIHHPNQQPESQLLPMAAYIRVSTNMDDQLNSFAAQMRHYREYISRKPEWELVDVYADEGISGTSTRKRDEFNRLMRDCRKGKIKRILVKSISRFARNTKDCLEAVRELTSLGVSVLFEKEGIDTAGMSNELFLAAMSDFAQNESLSMAGNLRRGIRMRMAQGTYTPTHAPFGYRREDGVLVIQPAEAEIVRWMFSQVLSGYGADRIAKTLVERQVPNQKGTVGWCINAVRYILANEKYTGDMLLQKSFTSDTLPFRKIENRGQVDRYLIQDMHTPIISREVYDRVQKLLEDRSKGKGKRCEPVDNHPFYGKILCGKCGSVYRLKMTRDKRYWVCRRHDRDISLCSSPRIPEPELERAFLRCYRKLKLHESRIIAPMVEQLYALKRSINFNNPEVVRISEEILALSEQSAVFAGLATRGIWDVGTYQQHRAENEQKIQRLSAKKAKLCDNDALDTLIERTRRLQAVIAEGPQKPDGFDGDLFCALVDKIVVTGTGTMKLRLLNGMELDETFEMAVR